MKKTVEQLDADIKRWQTKLKRAVNVIDKLQKQRARLMKAPKIEATKPKPVEKPEPLAVTVLKSLAEPVKPAPVADDLGIPEFLRRGQAAQNAVDEVIADQLRAEQEDVRKRKAQGRIEKMKAKKRGDLKKMPLSGKAALDAIRNG
jgi:hypothetical protein